MGITGLADRADHRPLLHSLTDRNAGRRKMRVQTRQLMSVCDHDKASESSMRSDLHDGAAPEGFHRTPEWSHKVNPSVAAATAAWGFEPTVALGILAHDQRPRLNGWDKRLPIDVRHFMDDDGKPQAHDEPQPEANASHDPLSPLTPCPPRRSRYHPHRRAAPRSIGRDAIANDSP